MRGAHRRIGCRRGELNVASCLLSKFEPMRLLSPNPPNGGQPIQERLRLIKSNTGGRGWATQPVRSNRLPFGRALHGSILIGLLAANVAAMSAAPPEIPPPPSPTVAPQAAEQGKDVVHALNNAFAKVFETVAPSVVIIEISKISFFKGRRTKTIRRAIREVFSRPRVKAPASLSGRTVTSSLIFTSSKRPIKSR